MVTGIGLMDGHTGSDTEIISLPFVCSPCVNVYNHRKSSCKPGECLRSVKVEDVYEKAKSLL